MLILYLYMQSIVFNSQEWYGVIACKLLIYIYTVYAVFLLFQCSDYNSFETNFKFVNSSPNIKNVYKYVIFQFVVCLFVCLLKFLRPTREIFTHLGTSRFGEGLQIFTCTRHSWPLYSEDSLACHTYCAWGIRL